MLSVTNGVSHDWAHSANLDWCFLRSPGAGRLLMILQHPVDRLKGLQPLGECFLVAVLVVPDGPSQLCLCHDDDVASDREGVQNSAYTAVLQLAQYSD